MMRSRLVCCIVLILVSITAAGQAIVWNGKSKSDLIGDQVYVLEDKDNKLTINDVSTSLNFKRSTQKILDFGSSNSFYWGR